jgi:hypothetical protein
MQHLSSVASDLTEGSVPSGSKSVGGAGEGVQMTLGTASVQHAHALERAALTTETLGTPRVCAVCEGDGSDEAEALRKENKALREEVYRLLGSHVRANQERMSWPDPLHPTP